MKAELKDTGRYNNDPIFRAAADAAHRADHESALPALAVVTGKVQLLAHHHFQLRSPRLLTVGRAIEDTPSMNKRFDMMLPRRSTILGGAALAAGVRGAGARAAHHRHDQAQLRAGADRDRRFRRRSRRRRHRRRDPQRSAELRPVPLDLAQLLHPARRRRQRAAALSPTGAASARPALVVGQVAAGRRQHQGRLPPVGRRGRPAGDRALLHQPARQLAAARPHHRRRDLQARDRRGGLLRHPHRLRRREPARSARASSASPSWTRTAPTTATSPTAARSR